MAEVVVLIARRQHAVDRDRSHPPSRIVGIGVGSVRDDIARRVMAQRAGAAGAKRGI